MASGPSGTVRGVGSSKSFSSQQNDALRVVLRRIVDGRFGGNQTATAKRFKVTPTAISELLGNKRGFGPKTLYPMFEFAFLDVCEILGVHMPGDFEVPSSATTASLPHLERALVMAAADNMEPATLRYGRWLASQWRVDQGVGEWIRLLEGFDRAHRETTVPQVSGVEPTSAALLSASGNRHSFVMNAISSDPIRSFSSATSLKASNE